MITRRELLSQAAAVPVATAVAVAPPEPYTEFRIVYADDRSPARTLRGRLTTELALFLDPGDVLEVASTAHPTLRYVHRGCPRRVRYAIRGGSVQVVAWHHELATYYVYCIAALYQPWHEDAIRRANV